MVLYSVTSSSGHIVSLKLKVLDRVTDGICLKFYKQLKSLITMNRVVKSIWEKL